jgi:glutamate N-acetyltransferase/amino-acid N-acetyltransferase
MELHSQPVMPEGFQCASVNCGLKEIGTDLSLFMSNVTCNAAAVFTKNQFPGAPVVVGREIIKQGKLRAIVVNSKVSNVGTGESGVANARKMGLAVAREFSIDPGEVLMSSTGVIAKPLPIEKIEAGIVGIGQQLSADPLVGAQGIMTTDTYPKALSLSVGQATLTMVAKGSGMIEPNMATMLVYAFTDADISSSTLDVMLRKAVDTSFNMLSVDTDTSTSDTCVIMASCHKGPVDEANFSKALDFACAQMTIKLARDGEGATKLLLAETVNAFSREEARAIAKSMVNSPLIKTMAYGADPNIGRVLMAVGKCFDCHVRPERVEVSINGTLVYKDQSRVDFDEERVRKLLSGDCVHISVNLNEGTDQALAYGCDLTNGYIEENAAYYSS